MLNRRSFVGLTAAAMGALFLARCGVNSLAELSGWNPYSPYLPYSPYNHNNPYNHYHPYNHHNPYNHYHPYHHYSPYHHYLPTGQWDGINQYETDKYYQIEDESPFEGMQTQTQNSSASALPAAFFESLTNFNV